MRKILFVIFLFSISAGAFAQFVVPKVEDRLEVNQKGEIRVVDSFQDQWRSLTPEEKQAYDNPGTEVPYGSFERIYERIDFFHFESIDQYSQVVVFRLGENIRKGNFDYINKTFNIHVEFNFAVHVVTLVISFVLLVLSFILFIKKKDKKGRYLCIISAITSFFSFVIAAAFQYILVAFIAFMVILVCSFLVTLFDKRIDKKKVK